MRITTIIPCFNAEHWIDETLASVAAQTRAPDEVILVDDGSTDGTLARLRASSVPTTIIEQNQQGAAVARNTGIERATGDLIAFLDADDVWFPDHLERGHDALASSDDVAYIGYFDNMTLEGEFSPSTSHRAFDATTTGLTPDRFMELHNEGMFFMQDTVLYRRDRVVEVGMFDQDFPRRHDIELWLRVIAQHTWSYDPKSGAAYRRGASIVSSNIASREYHNLRCFLKNRSDYPGEAMTQAIRLWAVKAVLAAVTHGTAADRRLVWPIAAPHLSGPQYGILSFSCRVPQPLRWANRIRHRRLAARRAAG